MDYSHIFETTKDIKEYKRVVIIKKRKERILGLKLEFATMALAIERQTEIRVKCRM